MENSGSKDQKGHLTFDPQNAIKLAAQVSPSSVGNKIGTNGNQGSNALGTTITPAGDLTGTWGGSFSMTDTPSDGYSFSGTKLFPSWVTVASLAGSFTLVDASSPDFPANDFCTLVPNDEFQFQGTVSSSAFSISGSDFSSKGYFTTDLIRGTFNECSDQSCASGTFTGMRNP